MFDKPFAAIDAADIQALVMNQVSEGRRLDYKEQFQVQSEGERKEFLSDISAFANTDGGYLVFGIQEQRDSNNKPTGIPSAGVGLPNFNADSEILRLDSMIRDGLAPRLSGVLMKKIDGFANGPVFVIHVPQSWNAPHMVTYQTKSPFHGRGNAGKFPMDVSQIRAAVTMADSLSEKIRSFHQDRVAKIIGGYSPVTMERPRQLIAHLIPLSAFRGDIAFDVATIRGHEARLAPLSFYGGCHTKVNLEGMVFYSDSGIGSPSYSYVQIYRNGIVEIADCYVVGVHDDYTQFSAYELEDKLIAGMKKYLAFLSTNGITGPGVLLVTLTGVKGFELIVGRGKGFRHPAIAPKQFDRDVVTIPEVMVEDFTSPADVVLKTAFDAIYNAGGWEKCLNYDTHGRWQQPK